MKNFVPIRDVAPRKLALPSNDAWVNELDWVPLSHTEFHLSARYFPLAVRWLDGKPCLGLLVGERYLVRPMVDESGKWQGAYKPIALRCFPFRVRNVGNDPMADLLIARDSEFLSDSEGLPLVDDKGQPSQVIAEIHRLFRVLQDARDALASALDQLLIGDYLVPLESADASTVGHQGTPTYAVDRNRFLHAGKVALAAMARKKFLTVDVAIACLFSLEHLRREFQPKAAAASAEKMPAVPTVPALRSVHELIGIDDFALVLDDGELISLSDLEAMRVDARQHDRTEAAMVSADLSPGTALVPVPATKSTAPVLKPPAPQVGAEPSVHAHEARAAAKPTPAPVLTAKSPATAEQPAPRQADAPRREVTETSKKAAALRTEDRGMKRASETPASGPADTPYVPPSQAGGVGPAKEVLTPPAPAMVSQPGQLRSRTRLGRPHPAASPPTEPAPAPNAESPVVSVARKTPVVDTAAPLSGAAVRPPQPPAVSTPPAPAPPIAPPPAAKIEAAPPPAPPPAKAMEAAGPPVAPRPAEAAPPPASSPAKAMEAAPPPSPARVEPSASPPEAVDATPPAVPSEQEHPRPQPAGTAGRDAAFSLRKLLMAEPPVPQSEGAKAAPPAPAEPSKPPETGEQKGADSQAASRQQPEKTPAAGLKPGERAKNVSPQISDMIRKLNELQALLRLD